ncbi:transporter [Thiomicrorhabdus immobilis]|uniref:Transporter n=1 Tax=Thiomicrorhabdus immobilis TaxID=2791037 RepID=A0ABN6D0C7_9GAMM|nr:SLAC1 anion channel family protein [Thiomicrorhabdus immobilis]BCN93379.1 transporter [Thiomicrorhabdus immobilis]
MSNHQLNSRIAYFPINLFGAVMGLSGLTLGLQSAHEQLGISITFFYSLALITTSLFLVFSTIYSIKLLKHSNHVIAEFNHPVLLHFFPTFSISLLLLSLIFKDIAFDLAQIMWGVGSIIQFSLLIYILSNWIHHEKWQITDMNPAWFIPVVGAIVVPLGAVHFANVELGWFFFSIGLVFWIILSSIVMYRLFFHPPMLKLLEPTLFILIAPPSVGFISYMSLQGMAGVDEFARILYYIGLFMTLLLLSQVARFIRIPFSLAWWAYTFPLAAISLASFVMYQQLGLILYSYIASFLLAILSALILHLTLKTLIAIKNKKLCMPPPAKPAD